MSIKLRNKLRSISYRNQSLQDILKTCNKGDKIMSISATSGGIHNTKLILKLKTGEKRVHFYNRVDLKDALPSGLLLPIENVSETLNILNVDQQGDFEREDLIFNEFEIEAHPDSLGFIGRVATFPWTIKYRVISTGEIVRLNTGSVVSGHTIDPNIIDETGEIISNPETLNDRDDVVISKYAKVVEVQALHPAGWSNLTNLSSDAEEVKDEAYIYKDSLTHVHIGPNSRKWGESVLAGCSQIESLTIDEGIEEFGSYTLTGCLIKELILPVSVRHIGLNGFVSNSQMTKLVVGGQLETVDSYMFSGSLRAVKHLEFRPGVKNIYRTWSEAQNSCEVLILSPGLINIGTEEESYIFGDFNKVKSLTIPGTVKFISESSFQTMASLEELTIEEGVGYISSYAFQNFGNLWGEADHPLKVFNFHGGEIFAENSFQNWNLLNSDLEIIIPKTAKEIHDGAFQNYGNTKRLSFNSECAAIIKKNAFLNWYKATDLIMSDEIYSIEAPAFMNWYQGTNIHISRSLKQLGGMVDTWGNGNLSIQGEFEQWAMSRTDPNDIIILPDNLETVYGAFGGGSKVKTLIISKGLKSSGELGSFYTENFFFRGELPPEILGDRGLVGNSNPNTLKTYVSDKSLWLDPILEIEPNCIYNYTVPASDTDPHLP